MRTARNRARLLILLLLASLCAGCTGPREQWAYAAGGFSLAVETVNDAYDAGIIDGEDLERIEPAVDAGYAALDEARGMLPPEGGSIEDRGRFVAALEAARATTRIINAATEGGGR